MAQKSDAAQVVRRQVAALNRRDLDRLLAFYAADAVLEFPGGLKVSGRAAIRRAFERYLRDWQEEVTLQRVRVTGEVVTAEGIASGRHRLVQLKLPGQVPIPLRAYRHRFSASWEVKDGKIRNHRVSYDPEDLVRQVLGT